RLTARQDHCLRGESRRGALAASGRPRTLHRRGHPDHDSLPSARARAFRLHREPYPHALDRGELPRLWRTDIITETAAGKSAIALSPAHPPPPAPSIGR